MIVYISMLWYIFICSHANIFTYLLKMRCDIKKITNPVGNQAGLSLVELLAVIVILGIIAAIAVPSVSKVIDNSRAKSDIAEALNIISASKTAQLNGDEDLAENGYTVKELVEAGYISIEANDFIFVTYDETEKQ